MLLLPVDDGEPSALRSSVISEDTSEEEVVQSDGHGHAVQKMRRCQNGQCEERTELRELPKKTSERSVALGSGALGMPALADPFGSFGRRLRGVLRHFEEDALGGSGAGSGGRTARGLASGGAVPAAPVEMRSSGSSRASSESRSESSSESRSRSESSSVSTETVVENGHVVTKTTQCVDDKCETKVDDKQLPKQAATQDEPQTAARAMAPKGEGKEKMIL